MSIINTRAIRNPSTASPSKASRAERAIRSGLLARGLRVPPSHPDGAGQWPGISLTSSHGTRLATYSGGAAPDSHRLPFDRTATDLGELRSPRLIAAIIAGDPLRVNPLAKKRIERYGAGPPIGAQARACRCGSKSLIACDSTRFLKTARVV